MCFVLCRPRQCQKWRASKIPPSVLVALCKEEWMFKPGIAHHVSAVPMPFQPSCYLAFATHWANLQSPPCMLRHSDRPVCQQGGIVNFNIRGSHHHIHMWCVWHLFPTSFVHVGSTPHLNEGPQECKLQPLPSPKAIVWLGFSSLFFELLLSKRLRFYLWGAPSSSSVCCRPEPHSQKFISKLHVQ